mmetsp:Transcript_12725/g.15792  ORF Transcript_12725/g.15792 Transcript_12725/m.15792 type:complete len:149 (-) Transcript_12725:4-450(-)
MQRPFSKVISRATQLGLYRSTSNNVIIKPFKNVLQRRAFSEEMTTKWKDHPHNARSYIFYDYAGWARRRPLVFLPNMFYFLDNYIFRSTPAYFTWIILMCFAWQRCIEMFVDWYWFKVNRYRLFTPEVLDNFPPEIDDADDDDDDDDF